MLHPSRTADNPFTNEKLETVAHGPDVQEGRDRSARNTEFELSAAARLRLGGLEVCHGEPDLRYRYGDEVIGVAVKRVSSASDLQVRAAVEKAVEQIKRSNLRGVIAIKLEHRLDHLPLFRTEAEVLRHVDYAFDLVWKSADYFGPERQVHGVLVTSELVRPFGLPAPNGFPQLDVLLPWRFTRMYDLGENRDVGEAFYDRWQRKVQAQLLFCATQWEPPLTAD